MFVGAGYLCGHTFERLLGEIAHRFRLAMLGGFLVLVVGGAIVHRLRRRRQAEAVAPPS